MEKRARRSFSKEFKEQVVKLYLAGKPRNEIIKEYELTPPAFDKWICQHIETGSFKEKITARPNKKN
jgi:transposase